MRMHATVVVEQVGSEMPVVYRAEFRPLGVARLVSPVLPAALKVLGDSAAKRMEECLPRLPGHA
jgi:hypothetical protein